MVVSTFETWLSAQMAARGIRSAGWLARESGLPVAEVADWLVGRSVPGDAACAQLAQHWGLPDEAVKRWAIPLPKLAGRR